jgi:hypothetical protein
MKSDFPDVKLSYLRDYRSAPSTGTYDKQPIFQRPSVTTSFHAMIYPKLSDCNNIIKNFRDPTLI